MSSPAFSERGHVPHCTSLTSKEVSPARAPPGEVREERRVGEIVRVGAGVEARRVGGRVMEAREELLMHGERGGTESVEPLVAVPVVERRETVIDIPAPQ